MVVAPHLNHEAPRSSADQSQLAAGLEPNNERRTRTLTGEIGTLKYVLFFNDLSVEILLVIEYGTHFVGRLIVRKPAFCQRVAAVLKANIGRPIKEIGDIDISDAETPVEASCA